MNGQSTITLRGPRGPAGLAEFASVVTTMRQCLANVARCVAGSETVDFDVTDLRTGSAVLSATPIPNGIPDPILADITGVFNGTVVALETGEDIDSRLDFPTLRAFSRFSSIVEKPGVELTIGQARLTMSYVERIRSLVEPYTSDVGSVTGRLEAVSIHRAAKFTLFPPVPGEDVECVFERRHLQDVLRAVDHTVTVYGRLHYSRSKSFPSRVEVENFEVLPAPEGLPTLLDLRGSLRLDRPSEQVIREARDEW